MAWNQDSVVEKADCSHGIEECKHALFSHLISKLTTPVGDVQGQLHKGQYLKLKLMELELPCLVLVVVAIVVEPHVDDRQRNHIEENATKYQEEQFHLRYFSLIIER